MVNIASLLSGFVPYPFIYNRSIGKKTQPYGVLLAFQYVTEVATPLPLGHFSDLDWVLVRNFAFLPYLPSSYSAIQPISEIGLSSEVKSKISY